MFTKHGIGEEIIVQSKQDYTMQSLKRIVKVCSYWPAKNLQSV